MMRKRNHLDFGFSVLNNQIYSIHQASGHFGFSRKTCGLNVLKEKRSRADNCYANLIKP